jgi:predicted small integral membrane protein
MNDTSLVFVRTSAFLHAGWHYLVQKNNRKIGFIWWFMLASMILYFPIFTYYCEKVNIPS